MNSDVEGGRCFQCNEIRVGGNEVLKDGVVGKMEGKLIRKMM
jgi:hypothetical protein